MRLGVRVMVEISVSLLIAVFLIRTYVTTWKKYANHTQVSCDLLLWRQNPKHTKTIAKLQKTNASISRCVSF